MSDPSQPDGPAWTLAEAVTDAVRRRHSADVLAVGVYGPLAHGEDNPDTDISLVVVTHEHHGALRPATLRIAGLVVDLTVVHAAEHLRQAETLDTSWPLVADRYLTLRPTYDPDDWHPRVRDAHLAFLAATPTADFTTLARAAWYTAHRSVTTARAFAGRFETGAALVGLAQARVYTATVDGLLTRTYFRDGPDAAHRTGLASANLLTISDHLAAQAEELSRRACAVDGTINDLFD